MHTVQVRDCSMLSLPWLQNDFPSSCLRGLRVEIPRYDKKPKWSQINHDPTAILIFTMANITVTNTINFWGANWKFKTMNLYLFPHHSHCWSWTNLLYYTLWIPQMGRGWREDGGGLAQTFNACALSLDSLSCSRSRCLIFFWEAATSSMLCWSSSLMCSEGSSAGCRRTEPSWNYEKRNQ